MQAEDFLERDKGPGVAAVVVLSALLEWLCVSKQLSPDDLNLIFDDAEDRVAGDLNVLKDARIVIAMMRARLSSGTAKPTPSVPPAGFLVFGPLPPSWSACVTPKFRGGGSRARRLVCRALRRWTRRSSPRLRGSGYAWSPRTSQDRQAIRWPRPARITNSTPS